MSIPVEQKKLALTIPEAAEMLGISNSMMYEVVRIEGFPAIRVGRRILINAKKFEVWVDEQTEKGLFYA